MQGEEYLTDVLGILRADGAPGRRGRRDRPDEILGVNDRAQLAEAAAAMRDRINLRWMRAGVSVLDPRSTWIDVDVDLGQDVTVLPDTFLLGPTSVATGARIGPGTTLHDLLRGGRRRLGDPHLCGAGGDRRRGPGSVRSPSCGRAPGSAPDSRAGAYVEIKNSQVGAGSKVPHLSYVGDAEIGEGSNIGAATIFVNYDGEAKHRTVVGDHVRVGSDTMLVAPVTIGDGAYTAAGSVITEDVPPGAMAVGRARQRTIEGWVARRPVPAATRRRAAERAAASGRRQPPSRRPA